MGGESGEGEGVLRLDARVATAEAAGASWSCGSTATRGGARQLAVTLADGRAACVQLERPKAGQRRSATATGSLGRRGR